jgi:hypothetical protein
MDNEFQSVIDSVFLINSAYAFLHNYGYVFMVLTGSSTGGRSIEWGNVVILRHVTQVCPRATILYLDSDAYIRNFASRLSIQQAKNFRHSHSSGLVGPNGSISEAPREFTIAAPIECNWMGWINKQKQWRRCFNMQAHNTLFRTQNWPGNAHAGTSLNTALTLTK